MYTIKCYGDSSSPLSAKIITMKIELNKREIFIIKNALSLELDSHKFLRGFNKTINKELEELETLYNKLKDNLILTNL